MSCVFVIKINKSDDFVDVNFDLDVNLEKRDNFVNDFELVAIVFFVVMKDVIDKSI